MSKTPMRKVTLTLPAELVADIDALASSLGYTRSAFLSGYLRDSIAPLVPLAHVTAKSPSGAEMKRYRGEGIAAINFMIDQLKSDLAGLGEGWADDEQK